MNAIPRSELPKRKLAFPWWITAMAFCFALTWCVAMGFLGETGNWVLIAAAWAAVMTYGIVSYRSFAKREHQRRASTE